jgi:hypothetical protein
MPCRSLARQEILSLQIILKLYSHLCPDLQSIIFTEPALPVVSGCTDMQFRSAKGYVLTHRSQRTEQIRSPLFTEIYFFSALVHFD